MSSALQSKSPRNIMGSACQTSSHAGFLGDLPFQYQKELPIHEVNRRKQRKIKNAAGIKTKILFPAINNFLRAYFKIFIG